MQFWSRVLFSIFHSEYKKITGKKFAYYFNQDHWITLSA